MNFLLSNEQKDLPLSKRSVKKLITSLFSALGIVCEEFSLCFVSEKTITNLHHQYFQDPTPTDTISFPIDPVKKNSCAHLGEVFVCAQSAKKYAHKHRIDPYREMTLYVVHGILHLLGYCDLSPQARKKMRLKEKECMRILQKKDAFLTHG